MLIFSIKVLMMFYITLYRTWLLSFLNVFAGSFFVFVCFKCVYRFFFFTRLFLHTTKTEIHHNRFQSSYSRQNAHASKTRCIV